MTMKQKYWLSLMIVCLHHLTFSASTSWAGENAEELKTHAGMTRLPVHRDIESADIIEAFKPVTPAATLQTGGMTVKAGAAGAVQIDAGTDSYVVESCFSYPGDG